MSADELAEFRVHRISVRTRTGTTGAGNPVWSDPVEIDCFLSRKHRFVRNANGDQVVSQATATAIDPAYADVITDGAQVVHTASQDADGNWVTVTGGLATTVISAAVATSGPLDLPDHISAALQ